MALINNLLRSFTQLFVQTRSPSTYLSPPVSCLRENASMNQASPASVCAKLSAGLMPVLFIGAMVASGSPAYGSATPIRAIFTGRLNAGQPLYPAGLGPLDTFQWAIVFNSTFLAPATVAGTEFIWEQTAASPDPLYSPETLTSPLNTGITGASYNSINTAPTGQPTGFADTFTFNTSNRRFFIGTGRNPSGLSITVGGVPRPLKSWDTDGELPDFLVSSSEDLNTFLHEGIGPSGSYSCNSADDPDCTGAGFLETSEDLFEFTWTAVTFEVPGPIGLAGLVPLVGYSRKLRRKLKVHHHCQPSRQYSPHQPRADDQ